MILTTPGQADRRQPSLSVASVVRIDERMRTHRDEALVDVHKDIASAYDGVLAKGAIVRQEYSAQPALGGRAALSYGRAIDRALAGLAELCSGLKKVFTPEPTVPVTPEEEDIFKAAAALEAALFPGGVRFLHLPWREKWVEGERLLTSAAAPAFVSKVGPVDFAPVLVRVKRCQLAFGKALGFSATPAPAPLARAIAEWQRAVEWLVAVLSFYHFGDEDRRARIFAAYDRELAELALERQRRQTADEAGLEEAEGASGDAAASEDEAEASE
jgi:hypothetical protein